MDFDSNGILGKVGGQYIAQATNTLPPPGSAQPDRLTAVVDVPEVGRVRLTFKLSSSKHHKNRNWFWNACYAECE